MRVHELVFILWPDGFPWWNYSFFFVVVVIVAAAAVVGFIAQRERKIELG